MTAAPRRVIAPVVLGCCHEARRCLLCNPPPPAPAPATVAALVDHYATERARPGDAVLVGFYGGPLPAAALLDAVGDRPFTVRVRPDLLTRDAAKRIVDRGAVAVELDALSFQDAALREVGRRYPSQRVRTMAEGLRALGVRVGVVLAPGLPGTDHDAALEDAHTAASLFDTARIHPVLVLDDSGLRRWHLDGLYRPLELGQALTTSRAMLDVLEGAGCEVIRVGTQPGPDGMGRAVAGPRHPSFRQVVEGRRALDRLHRLLDGTPPGAHIVIRCAPADQARVRGPLNRNVRTLRAALGARSLRVVSDPGVARGDWRVDRVEKP